MLPQNDKCAHDGHDGHGQEQPISTHTLGGQTAELCPRHQQGRDKNSKRRETRFPNAVPVSNRFLQGLSCRSLWSRETNHCKPCHCSPQRDIKKTARVVEMQVNGLTGSHRTDAIQQCSSKKLAVNGSPSSTASSRSEDETHNEHQLFGSIEKIKTSAVYRFDRINILPGNDNK